MDNIDINDLEEINITDLEDLDDDEEMGFDPNTPYLKGNPFKDKLKGGYSITVHYKPRGDQLYTYEEIIDNELKRVKLEILEKVKDLPRAEFENNLQKILLAVKTVN